MVLEVLDPLMRTKQRGRKLGIEIVYKTHPKDIGTHGDEDMKSTEQRRQRGVPYVRPTSSNQDGERRALHQWE